MKNNDIMSYKKKIKKKKIFGIIGNTVGFCLLIGMILFL